MQAQADEAVERVEKQMDTGEIAIGEVVSLFCY